MEFSADYIFLSKALIQQKISFENLIVEIDNFQPEPLSEKERSQMAAMKNHLYSLNEGKPKEPLDDFVELQFDPKFQCMNLCGDKFNIFCTIIVLLSSALIESYINYYLSLKIYKLNLLDIFNDIEKIKVREKWLLAPRLFLDSYQFDKSGELYCTLNHLIKRRNTLMHYKVDIKVNGKKVLKGNRFDRGKYNEEKNTILKFCNLPKKLLEHLYSFDKSEETRTLIMTSGLDFDEINDILLTK